MPTVNDVAEQIAFLLNVYDEHEKDLSASPGFVSRQNSALADINGDFAQALRSGLRNDRAAVASIISSANVRANLTALLREMGTAINTPASKSGAIDAIWEALYDYMHANSLKWKTRNLTLGSPTAGGSNVGDGSVVRLATDENGYVMEGWWPDVYTLTCERDARQTGQKGVEYFKLEGRAESLDAAVRTGSGLRTGPNIATVTSHDSQRYIRNPAWTQFTSTAAVGSPAAPTALTAWTPSSSLSNFRIDYDIVYKAFAEPSETVNVSIQFNAVDTLTQDVVITGNGRFDPNTPFIVSVPVYRRSSCDRNLVITFGGVSRTYAVSGQTNSTWALVHLVATAGANNWPKNFNSNTMNLSFQMTGGTTGTCHLGPVVVAPFTRVGARGDTRRGRGAMGHYLAIQSGPTPFVKGDLFTLTDTEPSPRNGENQHWLAWAGRGYGPHDSAASSAFADK